MEQGCFRQDLYYALSTLSLEVPPLRKRREDIPGWIGMFLEEKQKKYNRLIHLTNGARQYVQDYDWPGNLDQISSTPLTWPPRRKAIPCSTRP